MSLDFISPREFVESLEKCRNVEGDYRFLSECNCQCYRDAVIVEAEIRGLKEHPVLVRLVENY